MTEHNRCETCRFWEEEFTWRRRYPWQYAGETYEGVSIWDYPEHQATEWCGEWKAREGEEGQYE